MTDIIEKYKKQRKINTMGIIITSLMFAVTINFSLSSTNFGKNLKTNVGEFSTSVEYKADLYIEKVESKGNQILKIKTSKSINKISEINFSLTYNPNNIEIINKFSDLDNSIITNISENNGYNIINLRFSNNVNLKQNEDIMTIIINKNEEKVENINMLNANITDNENNIYILSTSGIDF